MKRLLIAALAAVVLTSGAARAQSNESGPIATPAGALQFVRVDHDVVATLGTTTLDRFAASTLTHFDELGTTRDDVPRMLVLTDAGPVLYDFRRRPPQVQRLDRRMTIRRVFWQDDEVVMQSTQGWFRFKGGVLTKLQSSMTTFH